VGQLRAATTYIPFFRYLGNTTLVAVLDVMGTVLIVPLVATAFPAWSGAAGTRCFLSPSRS
jgi:ABC-type maltose transport system permease subunit